MPMKWVRVAATVCAMTYMDVRYALRGLRNAPGYAATIVVTLALGLGATTAMLAVVDSVLLRPLAFPHAERIDSIDFLNAQGREQSDASWKNYEALRDGVKGFDAVAAYSSLPAPITTRQGSVVQLVIHATPNLFAIAGVRPVLGRWLEANDTHRPVVVIGNQFWRDVLHADPHVLGSTLKVDGRLSTIAGVMPADYSFPTPSGSVAVYAPLAVDAKGVGPGGFDNYMLLARRKAGVSPAVALAEAQAVQRRVPMKSDEKPSQLLLHPYLNSVVGEQQPALLALLGACTLLLLIACVNAANLQIARSTGRMGEMAMRAALGATRGRLLRQIVTESVTVSTLGAMLGLLLVYGALHAVRVSYGTQFARMGEVRLHPAAFLACAALALLSGVLAALAPALRVLRSVGGVQRISPRVSRRTSLSSVLVAAEVALTCLLLIAAGLFLRTFRALEQVPLGFTPAGATTIVLMPENPTQAAAEQQAIYARLVDRMEHLPGVSSAAFDTSLPFSSFQIGFYGDFRIAGEQPKSEQSTTIHFASSGYFRAMAIPLRHGRLWQQSDGPTSAMVGLVNEELVRKYMPGVDPIGKQVDFSQGLKIKQLLTIVGVVGDTLQGRDLAGTREPLVYMLPAQLPADFHQAHFLFGVAPQFVVRSQLPEAVLERELKSAIHTEAPGFAVMSMEPISRSIDKSLLVRRLALRLASGFGIIALLLAATGIYGVLAYTVAQRTREIGIRMALGSSRQAALGLVLRQAAAMCASGLVVGLAAVWPASRTIQSFLFGVPALDPLTLLAVAVLLTLICLLAAAVPARRAAAIDPMQALRTE